MVWLSYFSRVQYSSVVQSCLTLCDPMECSTPGLPVHRQLPEFTQTHVHWVGYAIQPSHPLSSPSPPLSSPSPPTFSLSRDQGLLQWVGSSHQCPKLLEPQLQHQSFQWIFRVDFLKDRLVWFPCCSRDSQESSPAPQFKASILRCSAFIMVQLSRLYMTTGKNIALTLRIFVVKLTSLLFNMLSLL